MILLVVLVVVVVVECVSKQPYSVTKEMIKNWASQETSCDSMSKSLLNPLRCKNPKLREQIDKVTAQFRAANAGQTTIEPVIFVPGFAGSGIDGYLDRKDTPAWFCYKTWKEWFNLWLAFYELLTSTCFLDNSALEYFANNGTFQNRHGVQTRPRDFGGLYGIDYVDITDDFFGWTIVFAEMTRAFKDVGFEEGKTLFGAPYDWRLPMYALQSPGNFADQFFGLVEKAFTASGGKKVHIIAHSYGGPIVLNFMNDFLPAGMTRAQFDQWVQDKIATFIPIGAPFSGTAKSLRGIMSGDTFGAPSWLVNVDTVARIVRSFGGAVQLVPDALFWPTNYTVVQTPSRNYSASHADMSAIFTAIGASDSLSIYHRTNTTIDGLTIPKVRTYCLYGFDKPTEISFHYNQGFSSSEIRQPSYIDMSDLGDGTVPLASLLECQTWDEHDPIAKNHIRCREYDLDGHEDLQDAAMIADLLAITTGDTNRITTCETKNLDAHMAALGDNKPQKAKQLDRLRATRLAREAQQ